MPIKKGRPQKAWIVVADITRPPLDEAQFGGVHTGQPLAVFPPRTHIDKLVVAIDALVQFHFRHPGDKLAYRLKDRAPYRAERASLGVEVWGGENPILEAVKVDDLRLCQDEATGEQWFCYTRNGHLVTREVRD